MFQFVTHYYFTFACVLKITTKFCISIFLLFHIFEIVFAWLCSLLVMLSGDVEVNPGLKKKDKDCLSICHWNFNSISASGYSKLFLLNSFNSLHKFDIICLSETYLDFNTPLNDDNVEISGYTLVRSDHPSNTKRGGVCLYCKNNLPLRVINIGYLNECLILELTVGDKTCNFVVLYRSPSQSQDEFETLSDNFEMTLDTLAQKNPFLMTNIGDAKSKNWYSQDKASFEGKTIESITSQFGLYQSINEPAHLLENSSSCIDLIFTSQTNLVVESGVDPSRHHDCHHRIVFAKFNLMISYPPPYSKVWHYREANTDLIRRRISNFNWEKAFYNTNVNKKLSIFNETILNVLSNYIPHETLTCDDKEPSWFKSRLKSLLQDKNKIYKDFRKSNTNAQLLNKLNHLQ